jgi:F-type H+-transporting ATPase subunit gamma
MASLRDIKKRIASVKSTQKITKAMKMIAAVKLRKAQEAILAARPYAEKMEDVLVSLAGRVDDRIHPLLAQRPAKRIEYLILTSDRGLAGAFNANVTRRGLRLLEEQRSTLEHLQVSTMGRKGRDFILRRGNVANLSLRDYPGIFDPPRYSAAEKVAKEIADNFVSANLDAVYIIYNEFHSVISQRVTVLPLLPIVPRAVAEGSEKGTDYLYELDRQSVLAQLLPRHLAMQIWRAMLESQASEFGARMTAMDSATKNAGEIIGKLTLQYNRARQASITKELMEVVSGAEALT